MLCSTRIRVARKLLYIKQGERYQTAYYWSGKDNNIKGHVLTIARDETGELRLYDPQTNKIKRGKEIINYYSNHRIIFDVPVLKPKILRIDDKELNIEMLNEIIEPTKNKP